jgi:hypothetical protein
MLPVTGLPSQVTVQSTPALLLSPTGIMLNWNLEAKESEVIGPPTPAAFVVAMGPAFAPPIVELTPQPVNTVASAAMHTTLHPFLNPIHLAPR